MLGIMNACFVAMRVLTHNLTAATRAIMNAYFVAMKLITHNLTATRGTQTLLFPETGVSAQTCDCLVGMR